MGLMGCVSSFRVRNAGAYGKGSIGSGKFRNVGTELTVQAFFRGNKGCGDVSMVLSGEWQQ